MRGLHVGEALALVPIAARRQLGDSSGDEPPPPINLHIVAVCLLRAAERRLAIRRKLADFPSRRCTREAKSNMRLSEVNPTTCAKQYLIFAALASGHAARASAAFANANTRSFSAPNGSTRRFDNSAHGSIARQPRWGRQASTPATDGGADKRPPIGHQLQANAKRYPEPRGDGYACNVS